MLWPYPPPYSTSLVHASHCLILHTGLFLLSYQFTEVDKASPIARHREFPTSIKIQTNWIANISVYVFVGEVQMWRSKDNLCELNLSMDPRNWSYVVSLGSKPLHWLNCHSEFQQFFCKLIIKHCLKHLPSLTTDTSPTKITIWYHF